MILFNPHRRSRLLAVVSCVLSVAGVWTTHVEAQERTEVTPQPTLGERAPSELQRDDEPRASERASNRVSDRGELDRIIEVYLAGRYEPCARELGEFLDPVNPQRFTDDAVIERGRLYFASCSLLQGDHESARAALRSALEQNPLMQSPDSLTFPPPVVSLFLEVRDEVQELIAEREKQQVVELRRENERARRAAEQRLRREQQLEKMAREERVIVRNSRALAAVPFGVGQFQNGSETLGYTFLVSESLLTATVIGASYVIGFNNHKMNQESSDTSLSDYQKNTGTARTVLKISGWSLLGVAALGVIEAQLNYKPERLVEVRERKLPPEFDRPIGEGGSASSLAPTHSSSRLRPLIGALPGGGFLGLDGQF